MSSDPWQGLGGAGASPDPTLTFKPVPLLDVRSGSILLGVWLGTVVGTLLGKGRAHFWSNQFVNAGVVAALALMFVAARVWVRRHGGTPPIVAGPDALHLPRSANTRRVTSVPYADIRAVTVVGRSWWARLLLDAGGQHFMFPVSRFASPGAPARLQALVGARLNTTPDFLDAMERRQALGERLRRVAPVATRALAGALVAIYAVQAVVQPRLGAFGALAFGANAAGLTLHLPLAQAQLFRLVTANLLHASWLHLFNNVLFLVVIGAIVERQAGVVRYLAVFLGSGILSQVASAAYQAKFGGGLYSVGASGALFGLLGAQAVLNLRYGRQVSALFRFAARSWWWLLGLNLVIIPLLLPQVDTAAHVGGLLSGALIMWLLCRADLALPLPASRVAFSACAVLGGVWLGGIFGAVAHGTIAGGLTGDVAALMRLEAARPHVRPGLANELAWSIAADPAANRAKLRAASDLAGRAVVAERATRPKDVVGLIAVADTLATLKFRLGDSAGAVRLEEPTLVTRTRLYGAQLARFLDAEVRRHGTVKLGQWVWGLPALDPSRSRLTLDVGAPIPNGASMAWLVRTGDRLDGLLYMCLPPGMSGSLDMTIDRVDHMRGPSDPQTGDAIPAMTTLVPALLDGTRGRCRGVRSDLYLMTDEVRGWPN